MTNYELKVVMHGWKKESFNMFIWLRKIRSWHQPSNQKFIWEVTQLPWYAILPDYHFFPLLKWSERKEKCRWIFFFCSFDLNKTIWWISSWAFYKGKLEVDISAPGSQAASLPNKTPFHIDMNSLLFY